MLHLVACLCLAGTAAGGPLATPATTHALAAPLAHPAVTFPGPVLRGLRGTQTPRASDFVTHCNSAVNTAPGQVGGTAIPAGTALQASTGCGVAVLFLDDPGHGHFHATFGVAADDTTGKPATVRVRVIDRDGYALNISQVTATQSTGAQPIDVDVTKAAAVELSFLGAPTTFVYGFTLTGAAWTVQPAPGPGSVLPAGARPVNLASASYSCNAQALTAPMSVTLVSIPAGSGATATSCGQITFGLPAGTQGTLVLRYGAADSSTGARMTVTVRALAANGRLLRKAIGVAVPGGGLAPLWVDVRHVRTVQITVEGVTTDSSVVVTAVGILPRSLPSYSIPNRTLSGGAPGASVAIDPEAFVSGCNSSVGLQDTSVGQQPVFGGTYFSTFSCGSSSLIFCCTPAVGTFHGLFGAPDNAPAGGSAGPPTATVVVQDKDNHVLRRLTVHGVYGAPGTPIAVSINRASVLSFAFRGGSGVLYGLRLTGTATISDLIYPPTAPPVSPANGQAVDPSAFSLHCNAYLASTEQRLVGATTLEGWALYGESCGEADLPLSGARHAWRAFSARIGIKIDDSPGTAVTIRLNVLNKAGRVIRHRDKPARYGYGPQPVQISLAGGAVLQIQWLSSLDTSVVYAMTAM